ncbi:MAG: hypothetical protein L3K18_03535 [Thermoplasmata archaeon]|nr:hypothetical protein [Thermoplasmata archaeon]
MAPDQAAADSHHSHDITVIVNEKPVGPFHTDDVTGAEIKAAAGLDPNSDLFEKRGTDLVPVENTQHVEIHQHEVFVDFPPTPVS